MFTTPPDNTWDESNTQTFLDYGRYFVVERQRQIGLLASLVPGGEGPGAVADLGCGEGLMAEAILAARPDLTVWGLDGSPGMLQRAAERLARFGPRFRPQPFDLFARRWPNFDMPLRAVVSSLAIHHLDGAQKAELFREVYRLLAPGGALIVADITLPAHPLAWEAAAREWDAAVKENSLAEDGNLAGFERFEALRWNTFRYFDPEDIDKPSPLFDQLQWLAAAGFTAVDVFWMRAGHAVFGGYKA